MLSQHNQVGGTASVAQANQLIGGLQQQQLNDLKQLQHYYAMQHAAEQQTMMFQQFQQEKKKAEDQSICSRCSKWNDIHSKQKDRVTFAKNWCKDGHKVNIRRVESKYNITPGF